MKKTILVLQTAVFALLLAACGEDGANNPAIPPGPNPCVGSSCDGPVTSLDGRPLLDFIEYQNQVTTAHANYSSLAKRLQVVMSGEIMPTLPTIIEAQATGVKAILRENDGLLRFESDTNNGLYWVNYVALPNTYQRTATTFDGIFSSATSSWFPDWTTAYSTVRVRGTISGSNVTGQVCVRTLSTYDWSDFYLGTQWADPAGGTITYIGLVFWKVWWPYATGQYQPNTPSEVTGLRASYMTNGGASFCGSLNNYNPNPALGDNPELPVQRLLGTFHGTLGELFP